MESRTLDPMEKPVQIDTRFRATCVRATARATGRGGNDGFLSQINVCHAAETRVSLFDLSAEKRKCFSSGFPLTRKIVSDFCSFVLFSSWCGHLTNSTAVVAAKLVFRACFCL